MHPLPTSLRSGRSVATGAWAAVRAPLWLRGARLERLLARPARSFPPTDPPDALALRAAHAVLGRLARLPGGRWRNTCLFRSVAVCLVLRAGGHPARVRLGVRSTGHASDSVAAHAWVEGPSVLPLAGYETLRGAGVRPWKDGP